MYDQIRGDTIYIMLYAIVTATALQASCYLLFRRGNAFAPDIKTPVRLRRCTAAFFAALVLNHLWYMPIFFLSSNDDIKTNDLIGGLLDCMTFFPLAIAVLFAMLQDRRRPLWPIAVMMAPLIVGGVFSVAIRSYALQPIMYVYSLLMCLGLIIYMVRALRQYGRWLRENYADLEHKEVWQSFVVLAIMLLAFSVYALVGEGLVYQYAMQAIVIVLSCYLLWRVETLSDLSLPVNDAEERTDIKLYLQHDISLSQLAQIIGTNRLYLSQHFSNQGVTYNAYINGLRIRHFINLYHETTAAHQAVTAQQLAHQSGFRSYNTFSVAFKKMMGMTATEWMRNVAE